MSLQSKTFYYPTNKDLLPGGKARKYLLFLLIFFIAMCIPVCPQKSFSSDLYPEFEYAYPDQSIWTTQRDSNGVLKNPLLLLAGDLFAAINVSWVANPYPAKRMFTRLEEGDSNFSILVKASRLREHCIFSKTPVTFSELRVYRMKHTPPIRGIEDFKGKQIITIRGYSYGAIGKYFNDPANSVLIHESPNHESAFSMLKYHRANYLLNYSGPSEEILQKNPLPDIVYDVITKLNVFLVLSKKHPNAVEVMEAMEKIVQQLDVTEYGLAKP